MALVHKSALISYSTQKMFDLVDRCEDYPLFLPWCSKAELHARDEQQTHATLFIDYLGIQSHFSTKNEKDEPVSMRMHLTSGPFREFEGGWQFSPLDENACKVEFYLRYEFSSKLIAKVIAPVFNQISTNFVGAFIKRAEQVYGH